MCHQRNKEKVEVGGRKIKVDSCMKPLIEWLNNKHITAACCCGHGKYPMTVVVKEGIYGTLKNQIVYREIFTGLIIPRKKRFYVKDKDGFYYIPETLEVLDV